jgi:hypothetical protein
MPQEFTLEAAIDSFNADVRHKAQQELSRFRGAVRTESISAERASFDQIEPTVMAPRVGRHASTEWGDPDGDRRWVIPNPFDKAFMIDVPEKLRLLADPTSDYTMSTAMAAARAIDDVIVGAFTADATSGRNGTATTAYSTAMDVAAGGNPFTFDKALEALENLNAVEEPEQMRNITFTARQLRDILNLTEFTSADFNTLRALQMGRLEGGFLGFEKWIRSERLPLVGAERANFYWQQSAIVLGMAMEGQTTIDRLPEHKNSIGIQHQIDMGAVRMRETGVGRILCTEP